MLFREASLKDQRFAPMKKSLIGEGMELTRRIVCEGLLDARENYMEPLPPCGTQGLMEKMNLKQK